MHGMPFFLLRQKAFYKKLELIEGAGHELSGIFVESFMRPFFADLCPSLLVESWFCPFFFVKKVFRRLLWRNFCFCNISGKRTGNGEAVVFVCDMFFLLLFFKDFDQTREASTPSFSDQLGVPCHFLGRNWLIAFTPSMVVEKEVTYKTSDDACGYY